MFLTHLALKSPKYLAHASNYKGYKILDNSLIENDGKALDIKKVLEVAQEINADELILPDVFLNGPATIRAVEDALKKVGASGYKGKLMAVVHGVNDQDWFETYRILNTIEEIDVLGIPKVTAKIHPRGRVHFANRICEESRKEIHLLGLWYSFTELLDYRYPEKIRSMDTCQLAYLVQNHLNIYATRPDRYTVDLDNDIIDSIAFNDYKKRRLQCLGV